MEAPIDSMADFRKRCDALGRTDRWIFRGHALAKWDLQTTLERALFRLGSAARSRPMARDVEEILQREFCRHFHRYSADVPRNEDQLEWLSIMQHHGAPTRLSDWTFSEYIALFFAINDAQVGSTCAIWAVNQTKCWQRFKSKLPKDIQALLDEDDKHPRAIDWMLDHDETLIAPLNPLRLSTRLSVQQGTFLVPLNMKLSFQDNFDADIGPHRALWRKIKIRCTRKFLYSAFTELRRVNITDLSLFPGIDGLARSMLLSVILKHLQPQK